MSYHFDMAKMAENLDALVAMNRLTAQRTGLNANGDPETYTLKFKMASHLMSPYVIVNGFAVSKGRQYHLKSIKCDTHQSLIDFMDDMQKEGYTFSYSNGYSNLDTSLTQTQYINKLVDHAGDLIESRLSSQVVKMKEFMNELLVDKFRHIFKGNIRVAINNTDRAITFKSYSGFMEVRPVSADSNKLYVRMRARGSKLKAPHIYKHDIEELRKELDNVGIELFMLESPAEDFLITERVRKGGALGVLQRVNILSYSHRYREEVNQYLHYSWSSRTGAQYAPATLKNIKDGMNVHRGMFDLVTSIDTWDENAAGLFKFMTDVMNNDLPREMAIRQTVNDVKELLTAVMGKNAVNVNFSSVDDTILFEITRKTKNMAKWLDKKDKVNETLAKFRLNATVMYV